MMFRKKHRKPIINLVALTHKANKVIQSCNKIEHLEPCMKYLVLLYRIVPYGKDPIPFFMIAKIHFLTFKNTIDELSAIHKITSEYKFKVRG